LVDTRMTQSVVVTDVVLWFYNKETNKGGTRYARSRKAGNLHLSSPHVSTQTWRQVGGIRENSREYISRAIFTLAHKENESSTFCSYNKSRRRSSRWRQLIAEERLGLRVKNMREQNKGEEGITRSSLDWSFPCLFTEGSVLCGTWKMFPFIPFFSSLFLLKKTMS